MKQILSIQSAVSLGFVGNRVAAPVMTMLGHIPVLVDSVVLAAHPGYGLKAGGPVNIEQFSAILKALPQLNSLARTEAVITGYFGDAAQVPPVAELLDHWQAQDENTLYILDPVLGDNGRLYVDRAIVTAMRDMLLPRARFITPNQFELEVLCKGKIHNAAEADLAAISLLDLFPNLQGVVVTGVHDDDGRLYDRLVSRHRKGALGYDKRPAGIAGGGDLLTAIFASWLAAGRSVEESFAAASTDAHSIIDRSSGCLEISLFDNLHQLTPVTADITAALCET